MLSVWQAVVPVLRAFQPCLILAIGFASHRLCCLLLLAGGTTKFRAFVSQSWPLVSRLSRAHDSFSPAAACSCQAPYKAQPLYGGVFVCWRSDVAMLGYGGSALFPVPEQCQSPNPFTGGCSCLSGHTEQPLYNGILCTYQPAKGTVSYSSSSLVASQSQLSVTLTLTFSPALPGAAGFTITLPASVSTPQTSISLQAGTSAFGIVFTATACPTTARTIAFSPITCEDYAYTQLALSSVTFSCTSAPSPIASGPVVSQIALSTVQLSWVAPSDGGSTIVAYRVWAAEGPSFTTFSIIFETGNVATTQTIPNVVPGHTYQFKVAAKNGVDWAQPSPASASITTLSAPLLFA